jgi:hypothetical protein
MAGFDTLPMVWFPPMFGRTEHHGHPLPDRFGRSDAPGDGQGRYRHTPDGSLSILVPPDLTTGEPDAPSGFDSVPPVSPKRHRPRLATQKSPAEKDSGEQPVITPGPAIRRGDPPE